MAKAKFGLVGLDIGSSGIRAVELQASRRATELQLARAAWVDLPRGVMEAGVLVDPDALTKAIKALWRQGRFKSRRVAFAIPGANVLTRQLDLPWMSPADFKSALRYQVQDSLPVDIATVQLDYHLLGEFARSDSKGHALKENRILIVAAERAQTAAISSAVRKANLEPVIADHEPFAMIRAVCQGRLPQDQSAQAIVDIGAEQMTVVIHSKGQPLFIRVLSPLGGNQATDAIAVDLGLDLVEAERLKCSSGLSVPAPTLVSVTESSVFSAAFDSPLPRPEPLVGLMHSDINVWATTIITEISNSIDYYNSEVDAAPIAGLTLIGRAVNLPGLIERVATQLPYSVVKADSLMHLTAGRRMKHRPDDTRLAVAIGLATAQAR